MIFHKQLCEKNHCSLLSTKLICALKFLAKMRCGFPPKINFLKLFSLLIFLFSIAVISAQDEKNAKDSILITEESLAEGKNLYIKHCQQCHGKNGKGDGPKSANFDISLGDFTKKEFKEKSKEEILLRINEGKHEMPSFRNKIGEKDCQLIINFILTLENNKEKKKEGLALKKKEKNENE